MLLSMIHFGYFCRSIYVEAGIDYHSFNQIWKHVYSDSLHMGKE